MTYRFNVIGHKVAAFWVTAKADPVQSYTQTLFKPDTASLLKKQAELDGVKKGAFGSATLCAGVAPCIPCDAAVIAAPTRVSVSAEQEPSVSAAAIARSFHMKPSLAQGAA